MGTYVVSEDVQEVPVAVQEVPGAVGLRTPCHSSFEWSAEFFMVTAPQTKALCVCLFHDFIAEPKSELDWEPLNFKAQFA